MVKGKKSDEGTKGTAADPRFAAVQYDPRFQRFPKNKSKVQVDDRFKGMFNDPAFQVGVTVDKRGRKVKGKKNTENMKKYYRLQDEDDWKKDDDAAAANEEKEEVAEEVPAKAPTEKKGAKLKKPASPSPSPSSQDESEDEEESGEEEDEAAKRWARMRGLDAADSSSSESSDDGDGSDDDDDDKEESDEEYSGSDFGDDAALEQAEDEEDAAAVAEFGVGALAANPKEEILLLPDATPRLACVDLDWENITAVDILVALRSFLPRGGFITSVTVYPSDYGLERMEAEAKSGPQGIWKPKQKKTSRNAGGDRGARKGKHTVEASDSEDEEDESENDFEEENDKDDEEEDEVKEESESDADGEVDHARLRMYERSKLRWYYAIVECDCTETANQLYEECDGMELMKTACKFDLRFVPEDQSFKGRKIRDQAKDVPSDYEPPTFQTKALQHTNVELTWDKGDENRKRALTRKLTAEEIKEDDFKAYLATDSEGGSDDDNEENDEEEDSDGDGAGLPGRKKGAVAGTEDDAEAIRERYLRLLLGGGEDNKKSGSGGGQSGKKDRKGKKDWASADGGDDDVVDNVSGSSDEDEDDEGTGKYGDKNMEMEVTFTSGLEGLGDRLIAKRKEAEIKAGETVWDAYLRRKKEKKAAAKKLGIVNIDSDDDDYDEEYSSDDSGGEEEESKGGKKKGQKKKDKKIGGGESDEDEDGLPSGVADDPFFQHDDDPFNDPFFQDGPNTTTNAKVSSKKGAKEGAKKKNKKGGRGGDDDEEDEEARKQKAELEMLLLDESALLRKGLTKKSDAGENGQKAVKLSKKERIRLKKESKRRERAMGSDDEDHEEAAGAGFKMNLEDPRFKDLLVQPEFALDPTDPRFSKAGPGAAFLASEVAKRRSKKTAAGDSGKRGSGAANVSKVGNGGTGGGGGNTSAADLKLMVASLKRKSAVAGDGVGGDGNGGAKKKAARK